MRSIAPNTYDEIEVIDDPSTPWGRIRIRESDGGFTRVMKTSIFLTPAQLEEHAAECIALAAKIRGRQ